METSAGSKLRNRLKKDEIQLLLAPTMYLRRELLNLQGLMLFT